MSIVRFNIHEKILNWANERNLLKEENAPKQIIKLQEEVGELCGAFLKKKPDEICDAVGDIQVVMIILCEQLGIDYNACLVEAYDVIKDRTGKTVDGSFVRDK